MKGLVDFRYLKPTANVKRGQHRHISKPARKGEPAHTNTKPKIGQHAYTNVGHHTDE